MATQARLFRMDGSPQGSGKKTGPAVAPKPKFRSPQMSPQPQEYQGRGPGERYYQENDFPPPPPQMTAYSQSYDYQDRYTNHDDQGFPPPPPPAPAPGTSFATTDSYNASTAYSHLPAPASYQQATTSGPTYTVSSSYTGGAHNGGGAQAHLSPQEKSPNYSPRSESPSYPSSYSSYRSTPHSYDDQLNDVPKPSDQPISRPDKMGKEAEVDALTNMLMKSMEASTDPDFFGMCSKCNEKVTGATNGCTAMDQIFHIRCFVCSTCGTGLRGQPFYALEGKPYCESCYMNTLEKCSVCSKSITERILRATGKPYHPDCFTCVVCNKSLDGIPFTVDATNQIHCIEDFHKKFAPRCCVCLQPIMPESGQEETVRVVAMDKSFHVQCYKCEDCGLVLSSEAEGRGCYPLDEHILCKNCNAKRIQTMTSQMTTEL